jgi:hypothetical protein
MAAQEWEVRAEGGSPVNSSTWGTAGGIEGGVARLGLGSTLDQVLVAMSRQWRSLSKVPVV